MSSSRVGTVVIAEDEALAREALGGMLSAMTDWKVLASVPDGLAALEVCLREQPALLIADIRMPRLDGLELAAELRAAGIPVEIIFVTAHDEFALSAFRVAALDYLLKPIDEAALRVSLDRVRARTALPGPARPDAAMQAFLQQQRGAMRNIVVRSVGRIDIVPLRQILAIRAQGNYAELVTSERIWLHRETMATLAARLDPARFLQVHRSSIVALAHVARIERDGDAANVVLDNGLSLRATARGAQQLARLIAGRGR